MFAFTPIISQATPWPRTLGLPSSSSGQANTILALVTELLSRPNAEVHAASFAALRDNISSRPSSSLTFHTIQGVDTDTALRQRGIRDEDLIHSPTTKSYKAYDIASAIVATSHVKVRATFDAAVPT